MFSKLRLSVNFIHKAAIINKVHAKFDRRF